MKSLLLIFLLSFSLLGEDNNSTQELTLYDKSDGMLDLSNYLSQAYGFLPIPTLITEPAVGYGAGIALVYLHDNFTGKKTDSGRKVPATMSGIMAIATENGTKFGAAFNLGYWLHDNLRTISFIGLPNINIDTYTSNNQAISTNIDGLFVYQALKYRVLDTNLFLGGAYMYSSMSINLDTNIKVEKQNTLSSLDFIAEFDARNNTLSPTSGYFLNLKASMFDESIGSDVNFNKYIANAFIYTPLTEKFNVNLKITGESIEGESPPFYTYPFIMLRGMPAMKVQGENILASELEMSWNFYSRYEALLFGGAGKAFGENQFGINETSFHDSKNHFTKGIGFRYLIAKKFGLKMGVDIASSEYDDALYIQFGSAWAGF